MNNNSKIGDELYSFCSNTDNLFCLNSAFILELSVKFASQICHENTNTPLDGAHLADFGIDIRQGVSFRAELAWNIVCLRDIKAGA